MKPGIASLEYKHRFVIGAQSAVAAAAAECAADQGRFWEYHDALFAAVGNDPQAVQVPSLKQLAVTTGLDTKKFDQCLDSRQHYEQVLREDADARNKGINATPWVLINGQRYQGGFDVTEFKAAVEKAKAATQ